MFASAVIRFIRSMARDTTSDIIGRQLVRSGTSIGANYREANRASSKADFLHRVGISEREAAETEYWLLLCGDNNLGVATQRAALLAESRELLAILVTIAKNTKRRLDRS